MTTEAAAGTPAAGAAPDEPVYHGYVVLEWPAPVKTLTFPRAMVTWKVTIYNATDGAFINTVEAFTIRADAKEWVIADMTMLADPDGLPVLNADARGIFPDGNGGFLKGTFSFLVAEMRVRS